MLFRKVYESGVFQKNRVYFLKRLPINWTIVNNDNSLSEAETREHTDLYNNNKFFEYFLFNKNKAARFDTKLDCDD